MATKYGVPMILSRRARLLALLLAVLSSSPCANALLTDEVFVSGFGATQHYYVARNGDDTWSGMLAAPNGAKTDGPFATFDHARLAVQALDKSGFERVFVTFRDGTYALTTAESFGVADSGSATTEIVYDNYPGETPTISGGVRVQGWINVSGNVWQVTLSPSAQYFENLFYNGARRLRPRLGGYLGAYNRIFNTAYLDASKPADANCPSTDAYECFDRFDYNPVYDPTDPTSLDPDTWGNLVPADPNLCGQPPGLPALQGDIEILVFEQFSTSKLHVSCVDTVNHRVYMTGPTAVPGADNASQAGFIQGNRIVIENVRGALNQPGQWFLDRSVSPMVLTYLANPGEDPNADVVIAPQAPQLIVGYGLQYVTMRGLIFEYDNSIVPVPLGHVSTELEPDLTSALSFQNSQNIKLDGIQVRRTAGGGVDFMPCLVQQVLPGDPASPTWCTAYPAPALVATTATANSTIVNSAFYDLGVHGIRIGENSNAGLNSVFDDDNSPNGVLVDNNVVSAYGRVIPASFGIGQGVGHGNLYTHNDVYDGYHCGISISHGGGDNTPVIGVGNADNTISFNHVHDLLQGIMNDGGSIRIEAGNSNATSSGNQILNNIVHDTTDASAIDHGTIAGIAVRNGYGGDGIYMDNSTGLVDVQNNLVYRVSGNAIYSPHGPQKSKPVGPWNFGQSNRIKNNILAFARKGMFAVGDPYKTQSGPSYNAHPVFLVENNLVYFDRDELSSPSFDVVAGCTYSADLVFNGFESYQNNLYWRTDGAFATIDNAFHIQSTATQNGPCTSNQSFWTFYYFNNPAPPSPPPVYGSWQAVVDTMVTSADEDAGSVVQDPGFANPDYPHDDFSLSGPAPVGFVPFDLTAPGRQNAPFTPPAIDPTFVTAPFDPSSDF